MKFEGFLLLIKIILNYKDKQIHKIEKKDVDLQVCNWNRGDKLPVG